MATVKEHYDQVLSDYYSWMLGGFDSAIKRNIDFFQKHQITPCRSGRAIDLGAGCGFQSIPLAQAGFSVTSIDLDKKLLIELQNHAGPMKITTIQDDLIHFDNHVKDDVEVIICMTDTLIHLESKDKIMLLFNKVLNALEENGRFIVTFRDLSSELVELDRFIPVKSDESTIFTCFLEYEEETVKVHDIIYKRDQYGWSINKSFYRKLRLSKDWVDTQLSNMGFNHIESTIENGLVTIIAAKKKDAHNPCA